MYKLEYDAKGRGRSRKSNKKLNYVNGGTQERKIDFLKIFFHLCIKEGTQERKIDFLKIFFHLCINDGTQEKYC